MTKKNILGLDLGTTSIGFAHVIEAETPEQSSIERIGVRVLPLSTDEQTNFEKGKPVSINADRTLKRGMRRNLDRYQLRRDNLIEVLTKIGFISADTKLAEDGKNTTHETWRLRSYAVTEKIEKEALARVFLAINKKRGYKSSRKAKNEDEGHAIDGMAIAKRLYEENLTPGELVYGLLKEGKKFIPEFYRSDLQAEFDKVWQYQQQFYPEIFTPQFYTSIKGKGQRATAASFWGTYGFNTAENKGTRDEKKLQGYDWRRKAISEKLTKEEVAYVLTEINNNLNNASGYLGAISDRSKELFFKKETVGQYLYRQLKQNQHTRLKNQVFYRQDYLDEFEAIWTEQSKHHPELTNELKTELRDITIFYQRKLKSQKSLISFCEFERKEIAVEKNGSKVKRTIGLRVASKSSPLFQEFKIWQVLNNILPKKKGSKKRVVSNTTKENEKDQEIIGLDLAAKEQLFEELNLKGNLKAEKIIELLGYKASEYELNYPVIEGNRTNKALYEAYLKILDIEGYDVKELLKIKAHKDDVELDDLTVPASDIKEMVRSIFNTLQIDTTVLDFNAELDGKAFEQQASYQLWHILYSYEGDDSASGNETLYTILEKKFGFKKEHSQVLANVTLLDDYGSLSTKAMRNIYPHIKELTYDKACLAAGYRHSKLSLTKEEIAARPLKQRLELLKKNSLRNPVVEKILNQMVNVVNTLLDENRKTNPTFQFDEVRIELARELKKNAAERAEMTSNINTAKALHEKIVKLLQNEFGIKNPSRNDIIRYKLYEELKNNGYKDLYTNEYIPREILFSKQIDIDHIIPQSRLFDDSFSNKTVVFRKDNLKKSNRTAIDYIESEYGAEKVAAYLKRIENLYELGKKNKDEGISKAKFQKLQKKETDIGDGFIDRDLRDSQYIAKQAKNMLYDITRSVVSTSGSITDRLREDWGLINLMQEINFEKFKALGLTEKIEKKDGTFKERIVDWSKRNDHRHHAMDALTVAFTKHTHIQYLNYLNARYNQTHKEHHNIKAIENKETHIVKDELGNSKRVFNLPIPNFRTIAREHLETILVSHKAKNKVVTKNKNKISTANGVLVKTELTPRGQLHKETVYGKYKYPVSKEEKVSTKFDVETINLVANPLYKDLLLKRLSEHEFDPKKAFTGKNALTKNPLYLDDTKTEVVPEKVKLTWFESGYSIRKDVTPENFKDQKNLDKIIDEGVKKILIARLEEYGNDPKKAFSDLDKNPIWLNRDKNISIKRVTISGVSNAEALHVKKDHLGKTILDKEGNPIPADFVSTGNNHHVAIYQDEKGNLQERVVSLFDALQLVNAGLPVIEKDYNKGIGWKFLFTMKQNEYFVFPNDQTGFNPSEIDLLNPLDKSLISQNLYRVQKIATGDYWFRHHLETTVDVKTQLKDIAYKRCSLVGLKGIIKIRLNHIGSICQVGE
jgi:CRISPR-associated endonuclease Csn1